jgi:hypothetical protein
MREASNPDVLYIRVPVGGRLSLPVGLAESEGFRVYTSGEETTEPYMDRKMRELYE